jgi:predicted DNA-binding protein (MmcQ/YjbR family)
MMMRQTVEDERLVRLTAICLALPETTRNIQANHAAFLVRSKTFAYFLKDHHSDGIVSVACKVLPGDHLLLSQTHPERYYLPAYIGARGWVGMRLDVGEVDWDEVAEVVFHSYCLTATKRLVMQARGVGHGAPRMER